MSSEWTVQYHQHVLAMDPFAYWMLDEKSGAVAYDLVSGRVAGAQNGAHTGVTLWQDGIGDGRTSPLYDGANDYTNVQTATFATNFDGREGSIALWARVANAGVWTDGVGRYPISLQVDGNNFIIIRKNIANNQFDWLYYANATLEIVIKGGMTTTEWFHVGLTWSKTADQVKAYYDGAQEGATQTVLGAWAGNPAVSVIGAADLVPSSVWNGNLTHCAIWDRAISADEMEQLYRARWS